MKLNPIASFRADFPDGEVEGEDGIVTYGGGPLLQHLAEALERLGLDVTEPVHFPPYGWRLGALRGAARFMVQVTYLGDEYVLVVADRSPLMKRLFGGTAVAHASLLKCLHSELSGDPRFRDIQWWDRYDRRGVASSEPIAT